MNFHQIVKSSLSESSNKQEIENNFSLGNINTKSGLYDTPHTGTTSRVFLPSQGVSTNLPSFVSFSTGNQQLGQQTNSIEGEASDICDSKQNKKRRRSNKKKKFVK